MSAGVVWLGLQELIEELRRLPAELRDEGASLVLDAASAAHAEVVSAYSLGGTGNLAGHVRLETLGGSAQFGASAVVKSTAKHAFLFERGSYKSGNRKNRKGANRGIMPAARIFIPTMIRHRAALYDRLKALVERKGFEVHDA